MNLMKELMRRNMERTMDKKQKESEGLSDSLNQFKGQVRIVGKNIKTGETVFNHIQNNALTNLSKSNIIRLLGQNTSSWIGTVDPTELAISKMRFSNITDLPSDLSLFYYDITEASSRSVTGDYPGGDGSLGTSATIPGEASASIDVSYSVSAPEVVTQGNIKIVQLTDERPPSHGTVEIELKNGAAIVETLTFANTSYVRASDGNTPTNIVTTGGGISTALPGTETKLFYDFTSGDSGWKFYLEEVVTPETYDTIRITYKVGQYNLINSIVPKEGQNNGTGTTLALRYGSTAGDDYLVGSQVEYGNSDSDFIDDGSVTFSITMPGGSGNGTNMPAGEKISYTHAFLFNERDDLFSAIALTTPFEKDDETAYFISWAIRAPE